MDVQRQTCQSCGSRLLRNHLVRESGSRDKIIVQCSNCSNFVARYILGQTGYYHHGKGFDSFIRSLARSGEGLSGKSMQQEFEAIQQESEDLFESVIKYLKDHEKL